LRQPRLARATAVPAEARPAPSLLPPQVDSGLAHTKRRRAAASSTMSDVEETLKRISSHKGVQGIVIVNTEGIPIRSTMESALTTQYAANLSQLAQKARSAVRDLDPQNDLTFLRVRTKKHEIMIAPEKEFLLVVVQNPNCES